MASKGLRKTVDGFELSHSPSHMLRRCVQYANELFTCENGARDLTKQQFIVLAAVEQNEGISQTDLVALTGIDRSTLAEMLRRMIDKGLLNRERIESDQRANAVRLGAAGRKALKSARTASERVEKTLLSPLSASDRAKFSRMLATIVAASDNGQARTIEARRSTGRRSR